LYQARWTHLIQDEWINNLLANRPDLEAAALIRTAKLMNQAIEDSLVENFEYLIESVTLPDPKDKHVLAAAIASSADAIVTFNLKDFGQPTGVSVLHPDDFCCMLYAKDQAATLQAIQMLRQRLRNPAKSAEQLIANYERQGLRKMARILNDNIDLI
jgi:predicted nucleic acid-binding protein